MALKLHVKLLFLILLISSQAVWADTNLDYQNRGDRFEGVKPKPVSGYDIEVISVLADYQEPATQLPDQLRIGFYDRVRLLFILPSENRITGCTIGSTG